MHNQTLPIGCAPHSRSLFRRTFGTTAGATVTTTVIRLLATALIFLPCAALYAQTQPQTQAPTQASVSADPAPPVEAAAAAALATPVAATASSDSDTPVLHPRGEEAMHIGVGDLVEVRVFDTPELSTKIRVAANGSIDLPAAGATQVAGMTPQQASEAIEKHLRDAQIMKDPHVTVFVTDYATQSVSVLGEVKLPGNYLLLGSHSLYSALSAAGGTTQTAGSTIVITHQADPTHPETIQVNSANYSQAQRLTEIKAGDTVFVSRDERIYVIGDVFHPGEFPIQSGQKLSILAAVALAQGTNPTAAVSRASILRKTDTGQTVIPVDLKRVAENHAENQYLLPNDVLVIPRDRKRAFWDATLPGLTGAVAGSSLAALILR
jgi:polysaccharide export outer membrane protein